MIKKYFAFCKNNFIRDISTSGGLSFLFAKYIIENKGIVYGSCYSQNFRKVLTIQVDNLDDYIKLISKSKYSFSIPPKFSIIEKQLKENKLVMICTVPCIIKALRKFLSKNYDNLLCIDLMCHGYSKTNLLSEEIDNLEKQYNSKIISLDLRYKHKVFSKVIFENSNIIFKDLNYLYKNILDKCQKCNMHWDNNVSDITLGDSWEFFKNKYDSKFSPYNGTNIIKLNTKKGLKYFDLIKNECEFTIVN